MITVRKAAERGVTSVGWLQSHHSFSFGDYQDANHMGYRSLRVLNDDTVAPAQGFGTHPHSNIEIISYVIDGTLEHRDSLGNKHPVSAGGAQVMSAGKGVTHSESNPSARDPVHFIQTWIVPRTQGGEPRYSDWQPRSDAPVQVIASPSGRDGSVVIDQDAELLVGNLSPGSTVLIPLASSRVGWLQVFRGAVSCNGIELHQGDGASIGQDGEIRILSIEGAGFLFFDLE